MLQTTSSCLCFATHQLDFEFEEKFKVEIEIEDDISEVEVELRYILDSTDREEIISSIVEQSKLDRNLLLDAIDVEFDDFERFLDDFDSDERLDSELEDLREENKELREENNNLLAQIANLNQVLMEQIKVIM